MRNLSRLFYLLLLLGTLGGCAGAVTQVGLTTNESALADEKRGR